MVLLTLPCCHTQAYDSKAYDSKESSIKNGKIVQKRCSLAPRGHAVATTAAVRLVVTVAVILCCSSSTCNTTTRCTLHNPPKALPPIRTNHLGIDSCCACAWRSSATSAAQLRCKLVRACVNLAVMAVTLCTLLAMVVISRSSPAATPRPADSYPVTIEVHGATQVLTVGSHWTARDVTAALEAKTGRSLRGCWLLAPGAKVLRVGKKTRTLGELGVRKDSVLEVRHRVHGGMGCAGSKAVDTRDVKLQEEKSATAGAAPAPAGVAEEEQKVVALEEAPPASAPSPAPVADPTPAPMADPAPAPTAAVVAAAAPACVSPAPPLQTPQLAELPPPDAAAPPVEGLAPRADPHGALRHRVIARANAATESAVLQQMLGVGSPTLPPELPPPDAAAQPCEMPVPLADPVAPPTLLPELPPPEAAAPPCENPVGSPKLPPEPPQPDAPCCAVLRARFPPPRAVAEPPQPGAPPQLGVLRASVPPPRAVAEPPQPDAPPKLGAPPQLDAPPQEAPTKRRTARNRAARNRRKLRRQACSAPAPTAPQRQTQPQTQPQKAPLRRGARQASQPTALRRSSMELRASAQNTRAPA